MWAVDRPDRRQRLRRWAIRTPFTFIERSRAAKHKVCGEFLPSEACRVLEGLGVWREFLSANPARIRRCVLRFGSRRKAVDPERAWLQPQPFRIGPPARRQGSGEDFAREAAGDARRRG